MSLSEALAKVQTLAAAEEKGDKNEYSTYTIRELQLAAETSEKNVAPELPGDFAT
jgi:hypothetical protein